MVVLREAGKDSFEDNPDKGIFEMDLHRLELPTPFPVGPVNAYLLRGDPLTLVDTGPKTVEAQTALERGVAAAGARLKDIRRILLTHGHTDHAGNAAWVAQRSGAPVHVHEGDRAKVSGRRCPRAREDLLDPSRSGGQCRGVILRTDSGTPAISRSAGEGILSDGR